MHVSLNLVYDPSHSTGPFKQGRSGQDWLFNAPLGSLATVDTDPLTAFAHLARMPLTNSFDPATLSLLSSPLHDYLWVPSGLCTTFSLVSL